MSLSIFDFSEIKLREIKNHFAIKIQRQEQNIFEEWFSYAHQISEKENQELIRLRNRVAPYLPAYQEEDLKIKFIAPLFYMVDFIFDGIQDWYDQKLEFTYENLGIKLSGVPDLMVAKGDDYPEKPYFFLQEFKSSKPSQDPDYQLLAEMLTALEINENQDVQGAYVIGRNWYFTWLKKLENGQYQYFISEQFDCLNFENLKQIYINLQAVKHVYCR